MPPVSHRRATDPRQPLLYLLFCNGLTHWSLFVVYANNAPEYSTPWTASIEVLHLHSIIGEETFHFVSIGNLHHCARQKVAHSLLGVWRYEEKDGWSASRKETVPYSQFYNDKLDEEFAVLQQCSSSFEVRGEQQQQQQSEWELMQWRSW